MRVEAVVSAIDEILIETWQFNRQRHDFHAPIHYHHNPPHTCDLHISTLKTISKP
jgi:hypothetical protein